MIIISCKRSFIKTLVLHVHIEVKATNLIMDILHYYPAEDNNAIYIARSFETFAAMVSTFFV